MTDVDDEAPESCPDPEVFQDPPEGLSEKGQDALFGQEQSLEKLSEELGDRLAQDEGAGRSELSDLANRALAEIHHDGEGRAEPSALKPAATDAELRKLAGLPIDEKTCGFVGPDGESCRLAPHSDGLHMARGKMWTDADMARLSLGIATDSSARLADAVERGVATLEKIHVLFEHFIDQTFHRQKM